MDLAKPHIDIGLFTNRRDAQLGFWGSEIGLTYDHMLKLGRGLQQHRFAAGESVIKVNHAREVLREDAACGLRAVLIARAGIAGPRELRDPDGNAVVLVPKGHLGVEGIGLRLAVSDLAAARSFYGVALGLREIARDVYMCGDSLLLLERANRPIVVGDMVALGLRYFTIQVRDCDAEHARVLRTGGREGRAPATLGTTARVSFVRDTDGNWIELSERASLTGKAVG
ncbi:MAG TPA: VOC family protein [Candidatus Cybelea sp.]|nr:VOC family protein [Candidatus Cybelea sp.]